MHRRLNLTVLFGAGVLIVTSSTGTAGTPAKRKTISGATEKSSETQFWRDPVDIQSRSLLYGQGGREHQPAEGSFVFEKEDNEATTPKFTVHDANGTKWKVKLGDEARPETVATRFVWAAGFFTDEDYFLPQITVSSMPDHVHRGKQFISSGGIMNGARLEREIPEQKKIGIWKWKDETVAGTREWNGLRVLMALINNWDLKDVNNSIYQIQSKKASGPEMNPLTYLISDLGATFGPVSLDLHRKSDKGELAAYSRTKFIRNANAQDVDFYVPGVPSPIFLFTPHAYFSRRHMVWIGRDIPIADARWMGTVLGKLSPQQIRDAFRAGGYSADEVEAFSAIMEKRIASLVAL